MLVGYARVSSTGQSLDTQEAMLKEAGCTKIFSEKESGAKTDRKELAKALKALGEGDVLVFTKLDRLARSTLDLLNTIKTISDKGAGFKCLADTALDTTSPYGKVLVVIMAAIGEFERHIIRDRCEEGRKRARDRGVKFGPHFKLKPERRQLALNMLAEGKTAREVGRVFGVSHQTIGRL